MKERLEYVLAGRDELTRPLKRAENQMKSLGRTAKRTNIQMNQFGGSLTGAGKNMRKFAMGGLQQAGYQIGDFAVQVANGTSKMQAFGQQAPQLLQIFGPVGAIVGAGVAIFAAFGVALEKTAKSANKAKDAIKSITEQTKTAQQEISMLVMALASVEQVPVMKEINSAKAEIVNLNTKIKNLEEEALTASAKRKKDIERLVASYGRAVQREQDIIDKNTEIINQQNETNKLLDVTRDKYGIIIGTEEHLRAETEALNALFEARLGTIDDTANNYVDILGSELGLMQQTMALNSLFEQRLGTIDDTANNYVDILGTEAGLAAQTRALNQVFEDRLGTIDDTFNNYEDILGSEVGLRQQVEAVNDLYAERLALRQAEIRENRKNFMVEASVLVQEDKIAKLREAWEKKKAEINKDTVTRARTFRKEIKELTPEIKRARDLADSIGNSFEKSFMSAIDGSMKAKDAFRTMASDIIKELYRVFIVKQITGFIADAITFGAGPKTGNTGSLGLPDFSYNGGGYTGNGARAGGMDGKGGFMAMLHPRETVVDHTRGQGSGVTVVQNINVSTGVQQTVRTEIKSLMPQIAESAKAAVADAKRRGGSYGRAFA